MPSQLFSHVPAPSPMMVASLPPIIIRPLIPRYPVPPVRFEPLPPPPIMAPVAAVLPPYSNPPLAATDPRWGYNTSDHTWQSVLVSAKDQNQSHLFSLVGATWNLMNKCVSKADHGQFQNNPWDYSETEGQYLARKGCQFQKIIRKISHHEHGLDFVFLQEIDCLTAPNFLRDPHSIARYAILKENFIQALHNRGWDIALTTPSASPSGNKKQKPLATLYNTKVLQLASAPMSAFDKEGFACEFVIIPSSQKITLVNLHLNYESDYSEAIPAFQKAQVAADKFTIMGGDTNHSPNYHMTGLFTNGHYATNLGAEDDAGFLTDMDSQGHRKLYDGFFVNPSSTTYVSALGSMEGEVFKWHDRVGQFVLEPFLVVYDHVPCTSIGEPWRNPEGNRARPR